jgi:hypothetical protein
MGKIQVATNNIVAKVYIIIISSILIKNYLIIK